MELTPEQKIALADSGKLVAHFRRYIDDQRYFAEIADRLGARDAAVRLLKEDGVHKAGWLGPLYECRYKSIDREMRRIGTKRFISLANGYSPRSLIWTDDSTVDCICTDLESVIKQTKSVYKALQEAHGIKPRPNLTFETVDIFNADAVRNAVARFGTDEYTIDMEGVGLYHPKEEKRRSMANIRDAMGPRSVLVTADVIVQAQMKPAFERMPELLDVIAAMYGPTGQNMLQNAFATDEEATHFYTELGFTFERRKRYDGSYNITCMKHLGLDPAVILPTLTQEVWLLRKK